MNEPPVTPKLPEGSGGGMATMKALELLEARLALIESEWKDGKLELARLVLAAKSAPPPAAPKGRLLRDR